MNELQEAIEQLEIDIAQNWNTTQQQFHFVKEKFKDTITSPLVLITAATTGAVVGRKIKTAYSAKNRKSINQPAQPKTFSLQKIISTFSEISTAMSLFNYIKKTF